MVNLTCSGEYQGMQSESWPELRVISKINQFFFNKSLILIEFCLLIPNIGPKVVNSVVKGDTRAFEVPLSYIGRL